MKKINNRKIKIVSLISREWSLEINKKLIDKFKEIKFYLYVKKNLNFRKRSTVINKLNKKHIKKINEIKPDLIFTYGWSDYLPTELRNIAPCLILHPSKLPKYRGGSPIQNQLIDNINNSAVSILYAENKLDSGNILYQSSLSLDGYLDDILNRIIEKGVIGSIKIIRSFKKNKLKSKKQNHKISTFYKRRTPDQSQILLKDFKKKEAKYFYNLVRGLQNPYPIAFIECKNKTKLYLNKVSLKVK